jgi:uncharacterized membrane protein HdeD (DUF308 family)
MLSIFARNWWVLALQGVTAVLFGILALVWPYQTLLALVILFGAFMLVDGVLTLAGALAWRKWNQGWWAVALAGVAGIIVGVLTFVWPGMTGLVLLYLIAAWAITTGILEIVAAIELRRVIEGEWLMVLSGILSVVLGVLLVAFPGAGALGLAWLIGIYALVDGLLLIALAFRLRGLQKRAEKVVDKMFEGLA